MQEKVSRDISVQWGILLWMLAGKNGNIDLVVFLI
jgi:hypothetical protein